MKTIRKRISLITAIAASLLTIGALAQGCITGDDEETTVNRVVEGSALPSFSVVAPDGSVVGSSAAEGKCLVLMFFNTWCPGCQAEFPGMQAVWEEFENEDRVVFMPVARGKNETLATVAGYWGEHPSLTMPWYLDPGQVAFLKFADNTVPRLYITDMDGTVRYFRIGDELGTPAQLSAKIRTLAGLD